MDDALEKMIGDNTQKYLKGVIDRIENLEEQKANFVSDIREVYSEAKGNGLDVKVIREVIKRRKKDRDEVVMMDDMIELYEDKIYELVGDV